MLARLTARDMPAIAIIGGTAVNIRLSTATEAHRATQDIDVVASEAIPTALEVLSPGHDLGWEQTVVIDGVEVDVIETRAVSAEDLDGLDDGSRLFLVGHRWALDTATRVRITTADPSASLVEIPVATAAGLVAAKSHAAGYPRAARRASKHGNDLYDIFRLIEVFDTGGQLRAELETAPNELGRLVAGVVQAEILANPARAMRQMQPAATMQFDLTRIVDVAEPFVAAIA